MSRTGSSDGQVNGHDPAGASGAGDAELESIVCAYEVWQRGGGYRAVLRDLPREVEADSRGAMRAKLVGLGKFAGTGQPEQL